MHFGSFTRKKLDGAANDGVGKNRHGLVSAAPSSSRLKQKLVGLWPEISRLGASLHKANQRKRLAKATQQKEEASAYSILAWIGPGLDEMYDRLCLAP